MIMGRLLGRRRPAMTIVLWSDNFDRRKGTGLRRIAKIIVYNIGISFNFKSTAKI